MAVLNELQYFQGNIYNTSINVGGSFWMPHFIFIPFKNGLYIHFIYEQIKKIL